MFRDGEDLDSQGEGSSQGVVHHGSREEVAGGQQGQQPEAHHPLAGPVKRGCGGARSSCTTGGEERMGGLP